MDSDQIQTQLEPFTYGEKYLERFRNFPYLGIGFELEKTIDNKKSCNCSITSNGAERLSVARF